MADLDNQTEEALGWAAEGKKLSVDIPEVSFKDAGTFVASMTPIIGDAMAAKDVYDELQKDEPNYYLAGALGGAALVGLVPGLGDAAAKAIKKGAKEVFDVAKRVEVDPNAMGSGLGNVRLAPKQPKKTVKAYKLFTKGEDGKLYPLFVDADTEVPTGTWLDATFPDYRFTAENGKQYVPSRGTAGKKGTGDSIKIPDQETRERLIDAGFLPKGSKAKSVKAVAARPGWHAGDVPIATHIGPETKINGKSVKYRGEDQVWAEVEMPADVDWQTIANSKARIKKDGTPDVRTADINDEMPSMGHYRYKTNPNMTGEWLIGGEMKVNRVLSREEVNAINEAAGVKDLPTLDELNKGYSKGGVVMDDYQYAEMMQGEDDQTVRAFAIGGLAEDVDPVSGNEVPTGSLPEEVRDDIPAQLSEGEYVVPADVVRFFGVKFFEDIRNEAKRGFADMEANGRIGGEPIGMEMAEDELPFDISELQIVDDETEEQPMMNMGGYMRGYADGGLTLPAAVTDMTTATGITSDTSGLPMPVSNLSGIEMKEYVGPNGEITYIQFINGVAQSIIPEGYTAKAAAPTTPAAPAVPEGLGVVTAPDDNNNTAHEDMMREAQERESIDWTSPDVGIEQYEKTMEQSNSMLAKGFSGLATVLGGPIVAGFMAVAKRHQNKKMIEGATAKLEDPNVRGAEREKWVSIHNRLSGLDEDGKARNSFTEGLANLLTPDDGMEYVNGVLVDTKTGKVLKPGIANSKGNDVVAPTPKPTAQPSQKKKGGSNDDNSYSAPVTAKQAASTKDVTITGRKDSSGKTAGQSGYKSALKEKQEAKAAASKAAKKLGVGLATGGRYKGGLMMKRKKD